MLLRRFHQLNLGLILLGAIIAGIWIYVSGGREILIGLGQLPATWVLLLPLLTVFWIGVRFLRWQFLLRCVDVRVPIRASGGIYLISLLGIATPAYIGEFVRCFLMRSDFKVPFRITAAVLVTERLWDIAALLLIITFAAVTDWAALLTVVLFAIVLLIPYAGTTLLVRRGLLPVSIKQLAGTRNVFISVTLSLIAWVPIALMMSLIASGLGVTVSPLASMNIFGTATLLGGVTLMPAGVGVTGSLAILQLQQLGLSVPSAVWTVSFLRLLTTGVVMSIGSIALVVRWLKRRAVPVSESSAHFELIASEYAAQFSDHVWRHLLERKISGITAALPGPAEAGIGLDLGCGLGQQCIEMQRRGYRVVGLDAAYQLVKHGRDGGAAVLTGDAMRLPFADGSFDFVYMIGVLHHLPGVGAQTQVCKEISRILKPNGRLTVHETNPRNALFSFYMSYIFPILKSIDEGTEWWVPPERWRQFDDMQLTRIEYSTFLPDFMPVWLMRPARWVERRLENGGFSSYSAHYLAVLQKSQAPLPLLSKESFHPGLFLSSET